MARKVARTKRTTSTRSRRTKTIKTKAKKTVASRRRAPARAAQPDRRKKTPETLRLRAIEPSFTVSDLDRSIRFYTDVLGFTVGERFTDDGGALRGVMLKAGACSLGLSQDDWAKGRDRQRGVAVRIWCTTAQDVDAFAARIKAGGGNLTEGPMDQPWGGRSLSVDDPDGFHLTIYKEV